MGSIGGGLKSLGGNLLTWAQGGGLTENSPQRTALHEKQQQQQIEKQQADYEAQKHDEDFMNAAIAAGGKIGYNGMFKEDVPVPGENGMPDMTIPVYRPAQEGRQVVTHKFMSQPGHSVQIEMPTPMEQAQRQVTLRNPALEQETQAAGQKAAATAAGSETGRQTALAQSRALSGVKIPAGSGPLSGQKYLPEELPGVVSGSIAAQEAGSNIRRARLAAASQTLGAATNPIAYRQAFSQLEPDLQSYFDDPASFDKIQSPMRARMLNMAPMDQQKASLMMSMAPEEWNATVDNTVPPTGDTADLNRRTKVLVNTAVKRGDFDKAEAALKDANDQLGRTETGVRTAKATAPIKVTVAGQEAQARAPQVNDAGMELMAEGALAGNPPSSRNPVLYAKVMQRAAALAAERGMSATQAVMARNAAKANQTALTSVTKQYETLKPFADMAEKNADILEQKMNDVSDLGAPVLNTPIRQLQSRFAGNPKVAAFTAAILPVQADFARILNSPTGTGQLTDEARKEMETAISPGATTAQLHAALNVFRSDAANRRSSYEATIKDLQGQTVATGNQAIPTPARPVSGATASPGLPAPHLLHGRVIVPDHKTRTWVYQDTGQPAQ